MVNRGYKQRAQQKMEHHYTTTPPAPTHQMPLTPLNAVPYLSLPPNNPPLPSLPHPPLLPLPLPLPLKSKTHDHSTNCWSSLVMTERHQRRGKRKRKRPNEKTKGRKRRILTNRIYLQATIFLLRPFHSFYLLTLHLSLSFSHSFPSPFFLNTISSLYILCPPFVSLALLAFPSPYPLSILVSSILQEKQRTENNKQKNQ